MSDHDDLHAPKKRRKEKDRYNVSLNVELYTRFQTICTSLKRDYSEVINGLIAKYVEEHSQMGKTTRPPVSSVPRLLIGNEDEE